MALLVQLWIVLSVSLLALLAAVVAAQVSVGWLRRLASALRLPSRSAAVARRSRPAEAAAAR